MSAFTPGPWEVDGAQVCIQGGCALAEVHGAKNLEPAKANARLMAAAPEMYEALVAALDRVPERAPYALGVRALLARIDGKEPR